MTFEQYVVIRDWMADMGAALSKGPKDNEPLDSWNSLHDSLCNDPAFERFNKAYNAILEVRADEACDDQDRAEFSSPKDGYDKAIRDLYWYIKYRDLDECAWPIPFDEKSEADEKRRMDTDSKLLNTFIGTVPKKSVVAQANAFHNLGLESELNMLFTRYGVNNIKDLLLEFTRRTVFETSMAEEAERKAQCNAEFDKMVCGEEFDGELAREAAEEMFYEVVKTKTTRGL
jgi:hypothetical protein